MLVWDLGEKTKETKHVVEIKIRALGHLKHLMLTVATQIQRKCPKGRLSFVQSNEGWKSLQSCGQRFSPS